MIAEAFGIRPGDEIGWQAAGEIIRIIPPGKLVTAEDRESRLRLFDQATARQRKRAPVPASPGRAGRGWSREDLYRRGRTR